jgi:hypothetical protein
MIILNRYYLVLLMFFSNATYDVNKIRDKAFVAYTHLGLGDHIICNGLLNHFSKSFDTIYLPVKSRDLDNVEYLYKNNKKIRIFKIEHETELQDIQSFAKNKKLKILKVGFKKRQPPFNLSFYNQFGLPYEYSIDLFKLPRNPKKEAQLLDHLKDYYGITGEYQLVHNTSSYGTVGLKINPSLSIIYMDKESDLFKNMFLYTAVIENSTEIHCLDSSFLHLVERTYTLAKLFFHKVKKNNQEAAEVYLLKKWKEIDYVN